jgi:uncharacterized protein (UPF0147 family)
LLKKTNKKLCEILNEDLKKINVRMAETVEIIEEVFGSNN